MARFFYGEGKLRAGEHIELGPELARHVRVLRLRPGEEVTLFDGTGGEFPARLARQDRAGVLVELGERLAVERESPRRVTLVQGISQAERMDLTIQKSVELGVAAIQPVLAGKSVVRLDAERAAAKLAHWRRVAIAACEQCGRNRIPAIEAAVTVTDYCSAASREGARILLSPEGGSTLRSCLAPGIAALTLAVGPEGGFDALEEKLFAQAGFAAVRLGARVLRTETAAPAALAALATLTGEF
jgi:16S rRNA (uracil1498-N3)-methyltransferase